MRRFRIGEHLHVLMMRGYGVASQYMRSIRHLALSDKVPPPPGEGWAGAWQRTPSFCTALDAFKTGLPRDFTAFDVDIEQGQPLRAGYRPLVCYQPEVRTGNT